MRYVLSTLAIMVLAVIAVILLGRSVDNNNPNVQTGVKKVSTSDYINDQSRVEFIQYGKVVASEDRRTLRIVIDDGSRTLEVLKGYQGEIERREVLTNNLESYDVFMNAINNAGFTRQRVTTNEQNNGLCPTGQRFNYILRNGDETVSELWNTSCSLSGGSFGGNSSQTRTLFQKQFPNYSDLVRGITF